MPQLDISTFPSQLFWLAVTFVVLYILMSRIGLPRLTAAIEARQQQREGDLARATRLKSEAEAANVAFQRTMADARAQAQAAIKETTDQLAAEAAERQRTLAAALAQQIDDAERRIAETKQQALAEVRGIAVDVGRSVVEKLTGSEPDQGHLTAAVDHVLAGQARSGQARSGQAR
jgi:F-type H+-transporting ATPase subunit b